MRGKETILERGETEIENGRGKRGGTRARGGRLTKIFIRLYITRQK